MRKTSGRLAIGMALVVTAMAVPGSAYAVQSGTWTQFRNFNNPSLCMSVAGGDTRVADGASVIVRPCDRSRNQTWVLAPAAPPDPNAPNGPFFIKNSVNTHECLSVQGKSKDEFAHLVLWHCKDPYDNQDQQWSFSGDAGQPYSYVKNSWSFYFASALNASVYAPVGQVQGPAPWFPLNAWLTS
jgi:hypothetical protein